MKILGWIGCLFQASFNSDTLVLTLLVFICSSISSWWGPKNFEGVSYSIAWFEWYYFALWSPQYFAWRKDTGSYSWAIIAMVMCWNWAGFRYCWQGTWWYVLFSKFPTLFWFSFFFLILLYGGKLILLISLREHFMTSKDRLTTSLWFY